MTSFMVIGSVQRYRPAANSGGWSLVDSVPVPEATEGAFLPLGLAAGGSIVGQLRWDDRGPDIAIARDGELPAVLLDAGGDDGFVEEAKMVVRLVGRCHHSSHRRRKFNRSTIVLVAKLKCLTTPGVIWVIYSTASQT